MKRFSGMYYKHQKDGHTVSLIAGISAEHAFIQVITNTESFYSVYPLSAYQYGDGITINGNVFSESGIRIHIEEKNLAISGEIRYTDVTPVRYDIMGPFKFLPMQCRHIISSLHHRLDGSLTICGNHIDFTGGVGYIEGDSGTSFPRRYAWIHCNDFPEKTCIMASVADIPFMGAHFRGCLCIVYVRGVEYRLATYLGVRILCCDEKQIVLSQGRIRLEIKVNSGTGHTLLAPDNGEMVREIRECIVCGARFRFMKNGKVLLDEYSEYASFEFVDEVKNTR